MNNPEIDKDGTKRWYNEKDELHRTDGPAVEWADGNKEWCINGQLHRLDGPAVELSNGYNAWYKNGKFHRLDGPAVEWADGRKAWCINGQLHRLDGPAIERANGDKEWWIDGNKLSEKELHKHICLTKSNLCDCGANKTYGPGCTTHSHWCSINNP